MAVVTQAIFSLATMVPMAPAENVPRESPNIVEIQVNIEVEATRFATASAVDGFINSGGVGCILLAIVPTIKKIIVPTPAPMITAIIFFNVLPYSII